MSEDFVANAVQVTGHRAVCLIEQLQAGEIHTNNRKTGLDLSCLCRTLLNIMQSVKDGAFDDQQVLQIVKRLEAAASNVASFAASLSCNKLTLQAFEETSQTLASQLTEINHVFTRTQ